MSFYNNSDWCQPFECYEGGDPYNLSGKDLVMTWKVRAGDELAVHESSTTNGELVITDAEAGSFEVRLPVSVTRGFPAGDLYWDLVEGDQVRLNGGRWLVHKGVTL